MGSIEADQPLVACTLDAGDVPGRLDEWRAVLASARSRVAVPGGLRVELGDDEAVDELARLVVAEQRCCAFLSFAITVDSRGLALEVRAPEGTEAVVASLFGPPADLATRAGGDGQPPPAPSSARTA